MHCFRKRDKGKNFCSGERQETHWAQVPTLTPSLHLLPLGEKEPFLTQDHPQTQDEFGCTGKKIQEHWTCPRKHRPPFVPTMNPARSNKHQYLPLVAHQVKGERYPSEVQTQRTCWKLSGAGTLSKTLQLPKPHSKQQKESKMNSLLGEIETCGAWK